MTTQLATAHSINSIRHQMIHVLISVGLPIIHEHESSDHGKIKEKNREEKFYSNSRINPEVVRRQMSLM